MVTVCMIQSLGAESGGSLMQARHMLSHVDLPSVLRAGLTQSLLFLGKRTFKDKFPGLTDLKAQVDTPRKRVERKVLSKKSLKRVAESINELTTKKYNDKFGNNFNYALKN